MMRAFNAIDNYPFDEQERTENLNLLLTHPHYGKLWIIKHNGVTAGYTFLGYGFSFEFKGRDAFVDELFILPEFQGKGLGKQAIDFIIGEAKNEGVKALHLEAEHHNERGLRLYRSKGTRQSSMSDGTGCRSAKHRRTPSSSRREQADELLRFKRWIRAR